MIKQNNIDMLTDRLMDISNPSSPNYMKYLPKQQIDELTKNPEGRNAVLTFLNSIQAEIIPSNYDHIISARHAIKAWEDALHCEFYYYHKQGIEGRSDLQTIIRTPQYSLPAEVVEHVTVSTQ
jgi:subtilase family serine protease